MRSSSSITECADCKHEATDHADSEGCTAIVGYDRETNSFERCDCPRRFVETLKVQL